MGAPRAARAAYSYYIQSQIRADFQFGLSPGGLATNSYDGRSFWDTETWMFPVLDVLHPGVGESLLRYRLARLDAARIRAGQHVVGAGQQSNQWGVFLVGLSASALPRSRAGHVGA